MLAFNLNALIPWKNKLLVLSINPRDACLSIKGRDPTQCQLHIWRGIRFVSRLGVSALLSRVCSKANVLYVCKKRVNNTTSMRTCILFKQYFIRIVWNEHTNNIQFVWNKDTSTENLRVYIPTGHTMLNEHFTLSFDILFVNSKGSDGIWKALIYPLDTRWINSE